MAFLPILVHELRRAKMCFFLISVHRVWQEVCFAQNSTCSFSTTFWWTSLPLLSLWKNFLPEFNPQKSSQTQPFAQSQGYRINRLNTLNNALRNMCFGFSCNIFFESCIKNWERLWNIWSLLQADVASFTRKRGIEMGQNAQNLLCFWENRFSAPFFSQLKRREIKLRRYNSSLSDIKLKCLFPFSSDGQ